MKVSWMWHCQSYIETTSISLHRDTLSSRKEWIVSTDFSPPDFKSLNQRPDGKREGMSSLVFKVNLLKPEMREKHGETVVLKVLEIIHSLAYQYHSLALASKSLKVESIAYSNDIVVVITFILYINGAVVVKH